MRRRSRRLRALIRCYMSKALSLFDYLQNCRPAASPKDSGKRPGRRRIRRVGRIKRNFFRSPESFMTIPTPVWGQHFCYCCIFATPMLDRLTS